ncbi:MAG: hypothetical protein Q4B45_07475 [Coriobacteriia bacterium]|nr:hypothetical protein [Coriobacteriia bacterium]
MKKSLTCYISLVASVLLIVAGVYYVANGTAVDNFNPVVVGCLAAAVVFDAVFVFVDTKWFDLGNLAAVPCVAAAIAQVLINSINTFADVFSGITMFNSKGGVEWIFATVGMLVVALLAEIVSCFISRDPKRA